MLFINFKQINIRPVATLSLLVISFNLIAQNAGISFNGTAPNAAAAFDVDVKNFPGQKKGLLIPRVTLAERTAMNPLPAAAQGLMVYQTDGEQGFYYNSSGTVMPSWTMLQPAQSTRWNQLLSANDNLTLFNGTASTAIRFDGFTAGNAFAISSNSITTASLLNISSTSGAGGSISSTRLVQISRSGANLNQGHTAIGISSSVSNTGNFSTNYAGYFLSTGAVNNYAIFVPVAGGRISIGADASHVNAVLSINNGHFQSQQSVLPSIKTDLNAGLLSSGVIDGGSSDVAGSFTITSTSSNLSFGLQATISFNKAFAKKPRVVLSPANNNAASRAYYVLSNLTGFSIYFLIAPLPDTSYSFNYIVFDN